MNAMAVHYSSKTDRWATPQRFFDELAKEFAFTVDVCASADNAKCPQFFTTQQNGLEQDWRGVCWMNPPYGDTIGEWVRKAFQSARRNGATVVCLLPSRTDTAWWHDYVMRGEVRFIRGRLAFGSSKSKAPFPSAVVIFRPEFVGVEVFPPDEDE